MIRELCETRMPESVRAKDREQVCDREDRRAHNNLLAIIRSAAVQCGAKPKFIPHVSIEASLLVRTYRLYIFIEYGPYRVGLVACARSTVTGVLE